MTKIFTNTIQYLFYGLFTHLINFMIYFTYFIENLKFKNNSWGNECCLCLKKEESEIIFFILVLFCSILFYFYEKQGSNFSNSIFFI